MESASNWASSRRGVREERGVIRGRRWLMAFCCSIQEMQSPKVLCSQSSCQAVRVAFIVADGGEEADGSPVWVSIASMCVVFFVMSSW